MKIAVSTASGSLGSTVIRNLIAKVGSDSVLGIARTPSKATDLKVEIRKGDYDSQSDFEKALEGITHLLIVSGNSAPDHRIGQHRHIIEAAKQNKVKKIVYTSIIGAEEGNNFSPIVLSNRQTEQDIQNSGLDWVIGRNSIYIEPDLASIDDYLKEGQITNSAAAGKCGYTNRLELAQAYSHMLLEDKHNGQVYNLNGTPVTQSQLVDAINMVYSADLVYKAISAEAYLQERKEQLGDFLGTAIAGIYDGIRQGFLDVPSDFEKLVGRPHTPLLKMIQEYKSNAS